MAGENSRIGRPKFPSQKIGKGVTQKLENEPNCIKWLLKLKKKLMFNIGYKQDPESIK